MQILSLEVFDWCGLTHQVLTHLSERLTVISGPNEAGKSRMVEALHCALFESHRGGARHKRELRSWDSANPPRVIVRFSIDGREYTVEKQFLDRPFCRLSTSGQTWNDREALEQLKTLIGARDLNDRQAVVSDLGLWPLVWLRQGQSRTSPSADLNDDVQSALESTLADQIGAVATGATGLRVVDAVQTLRGQFFTPTGRPTGALLAATDARDTARQRFETASAAVRRVRGLADEVVRLQAVERDLNTRAADARSRVADARRDADAAAHVQGELAKKGLVCQAAEDAAKAAQRACEEHTVLATRLQAVGCRLAELETRAAALQSRHLAHDVDRILVDEQRTDAERTLGEARDRVAAAQALREHTQTTALLQSQQAQVAEARTVAERAKDLQASVARNHWSAAHLEAVEALSVAAHTAELALEHAAVAVHFTAEVATALNGESLAAGETRAFTTVQPLELTVPSGILTVTPGSDTQATLESAAQQSSDALQAALGDCPTLVEARLQAAARREAQVRLEECEARLVGLAPNGVAAAEAELEAQRDALGAAPTATHTLADAEHQRTEAALAVEALEARAGVLVSALHALQLEQTECTTEANALRLEAEVLEGRLATLEDANTLAERQRAAALAFADATAAVCALETAFAQAGGAETGQTLTRRQRALDGLVGQQQKNQRDLTTALAQLELQVGVDLHGEHQSAEAEVQRTEADLCRIEARARSLELLLTTLQGQRNALQERLVGPVRQRIEPQIRRIFPNSKLAFDDAGQIIGLETGTVTEPFEKLSGGAQEQLSILVRMGLASIISGERRIPIVLDDALVNTDRTRLEAMLAAFDESADEDLQVIVFTCHEADFDQLGADVHHTLVGTRT